MLRHAIALACCIGASLAQDPADGWMAYAVGAVPSSVTRITKLEMSWKVGANPKSGNAFFSPWFGMDPQDNLNLVQPVNPWMGDGWSAYTEYFQWSPTHNSNSRQFSVKAGDTLHGSVVYQPDDDSYLLTQESASGGQSTQVVKCQDGKKYTLPYVVYEKEWRCSAYPPDGVVTFNNITIECDGSDCTDTVKWSAQVKGSNCDMTAHVDKYPAEISITWDTSKPSKFDGMREEELIERNSRSGWGRMFRRARMGA